MGNKVAYPLLGIGNPETEDILRNLISNRHMRFYDYSNAFSFRTVFYQSPYSYCCCPCAYNHEYMEYISETGEISEDICNIVLKSILNGKCPHVKFSNIKYTRETKVLAIHIAAAVGTVVKSDYFKDDIAFRETAIFELRPYELALLKNRLNFVDWFQKQLKEHYKNNKDVPYTIASSVKYAEISKEKKELITFETLRGLEFCVQMRNRRLVELILDPFFIHCETHKVLKVCFGDPELDDIKITILGYLRKTRFQFWVLNATQCAISAIAYDDEATLKTILDILKSRKTSEHLLVQLPNICDVLRKFYVKKILSDYGYKGMKMAVGDHFYLTMLHNLREYYSNRHFREIKSAFDALSGEQKAINKDYDNMGGFTPLHSAVSNLTAREAGIIMEYGADIDILNKHGQTPLTELFQGIGKWFKLDTMNFRRSLALLIYENPDVGLNKSVVEDALIVDELFYKNENKPTFEKEGLTFQIKGTYKMDGEVHYVLSDDYELALSYFAPLLIHCGFIYNDDLLLNALEKDLECAEKNYFRHCMNNPRTLQLSCRDSLRKHFKNRAIHRYLETLNIPRKIQDFILIKDIVEANKTFH